MRLLHRAADLRGGQVGDDQIAGVAVQLDAVAADFELQLVGTGRPVLPALGPAPPLTLAPGRARPVAGPARPVAGPARPVAGRLTRRLRSAAAPPSPAPGTVLFCHGSLLYPMAGRRTSEVWN